MLVMIKVIAAVDFPNRTLITSNGDMLESPIDKEMIIKQTSPALSPRNNGTCLLVAVKSDLLF